MTDKSHLTAISRNSPSLPLRQALGAGLFLPNLTVLDYGCGRGQDIEYLRKYGYEVDGYDPYYQPDIPNKGYHVVMCSFVLNVIADPHKRLEVLYRIQGLLRIEGRLVTTVRSKKQVDKLAKAGGWKVHNDGYLTPKHTFQRGFTSVELTELHEAGGFRLETHPKVKDAVCGVFRRRHD